MHEFTGRVSPNTSTPTSVTLAILGVLALQGEEDTESFPVFAKGRFSSAMKRVQETRREEQEEAIGQALELLIHTTEDTKVAALAEIKAADKARKKAKQRLDNIDRASDYAAETENFVPLVAALGVDWGDLGITYEDYQRLKVIPKEWTKKETTAAEATTKPSTEG